MSLSKKYGIPQEKINEMIKDGVISCSWPNYDQVYTMYKESMQITGKAKHEIIYDIAEKTHMTTRNVRYIIEKFE